MTSHLKALHTLIPRAKTKAPLIARGVLLSFLLVALFQLESQTTALQRIHERGELVVTGVSGPTTFYQTSAGSRGLQFELARQFADELGVKLTLQDAPSTSAILSGVRRNRTDIAITGLASDDKRLKHLRTATPYMAVSEQLIQRLDKPLPASFDALETSRIGVIAGSSEARRLQAMTQWRPDLQIIAFDNEDALALMQRLTNKELDYIALNSNEFDARRALFPAIGVALNLQENSELAWALLKTHDQSLFNAAQAFLARKQADGSLSRLVAFYSQGDTFAAGAVRSFQNDISQRLPRYQALFQSSAQKHGMDWHLLAAIAYQESRWQPLAVSPTGVQGMMMLTADTASYMGVTDRTNVPQSIRGGAAYYKMVLNELPSSVREPDRTWMALAAYNMGPAHITRARAHAARAGDDANKWMVVSRHLRDMGQEAKKQGRTLQVGQALDYVQQVRRYYDALVLVSSSNADARVAMLSTQNAAN